MRAANSSAIPASSIQRHARLDADDFQRAGQPDEVIVQPEELSAEGPQLLGDGGSLNKARIVDRHRRRRGRNPLPVEKRKWLVHAGIIAGG